MHLARTAVCLPCYLAMVARHMRDYADRGHTERIVGCDSTGDASLEPTWRWKLTLLIFNSLKKSLT